MNQYFIYVIVLGYVYFEINKIDLLFSICICFNSFQLRQIEGLYNLDVALYLYKSATRAHFLNECLNLWVMTHETALD